MDDIHHERTPLPSVPWLQQGPVTVCLQFKMVDGVQPALQRTARLQNMDSLPLVRLMDKEEDGPIRSTGSKVDSGVARILVRGRP